jgi:hypothetical protein
MNQPPRSEPYTDTILLDCSRATSEEVRGDPTNDQNAIFTNKLGSGIKLNPGDKVSVSSAFVSERGCGGSVIEFKGEPVPGQKYDLTETTVVKSQFPRYTAEGLGFFGVETQFPDTPAPFPDIGPMNCHKVNHEKTTRTFQLQDNQVSFEQTFYKTTNGEGYFHLPRRWDFTYAPGTVQVADAAPALGITRDPYRYTPEGFGQGRLSTANALVAPEYDCAKNGRATISPHIFKCCPADWYLYTGINSYSQGLNQQGDAAAAAQRPGEIADGGIAASRSLQAYVPKANAMGGGQWQLGNLELEVAGQLLYRQIENDDFAEDDFIMKQKNDNSRYTIYAKDICHYAEHIADLGGVASVQTAMPLPLYEMPEHLTYDAARSVEHASRDDFLGVDGGGDMVVSGNKEPSLSGYTKYQEIKTINVPKGFNSPANVAESITNQLNATKDQRIIKGFSGPLFAPGPLGHSAGLDPITTMRPTPPDVNPALWVTGFLDQRRGNQVGDIEGFLDPVANTKSDHGSTLNTTQRQISVSTILESETLKSFACANMENYSKKNFILYRGADPDAVGAAYATIGAPAIINHDYPAKPAPATFTNPDGTLIAGTEQTGTIPVSGIETVPNAVGNIQYMSSHQYIGVKRPDLFDAFREFYGTGNQEESTLAQVFPDVDPANPATAYSWRNLDAAQCLSGIPRLYQADCPFITTIEWNPTNLQKFANVFDTQAKYPELFNGYAFSNIEENTSLYKTRDGGKGMSSDHMRFIHLNSFEGDYPVIHKVTIDAAGAYAALGTHAIYTSSATRTQLGDDNINTPLRPDSARVPTGPSPASGLWDASRNAMDFSSNPMFIWYDETSKDNTDNDGTRSAGNLAYGCMFKYTVPHVVEPSPVLEGIDNTAAPGTDFDLDAEVRVAVRAQYGRTVSFIGFVTKTIGGLPNQLFMNKATDFNPAVWGVPGSIYNYGIPRPTRIRSGVDTGAGNSTDVQNLITDHSGCGCGFDIHFNAYGTSCIALYSGYLAGDKYAVPDIKEGHDLPVGVTGEFYYDRGMGENDINTTGTPTGGPLGQTILVDKGTNTTKLTTDTGAAHPVNPKGKMFRPMVLGVPGIWTKYPKLADGVTPKPLKCTDFKTGHGNTPAIVTSSNPLTWDTAGIVGNAVIEWLDTTPYTTFAGTCVSKFIKERYVGANQPLLNFDDKGERFNFQQLHTPLYVPNEANAGDGLTAVAETAGQQVLEINRRLLGNDFSPEMMPYQTPIIHDGSAHRQKDNPEDVDDQTPPVQEMNTNLIPWQMYDADGGIFLEGFGLNAEQWKKSLWGVLGFSYEQFHPTAGTFNRQTQINNIVQNDANVITTNANLEASDIIKFRGNRYGSSLFTNQPPVASVNGSYETARFQQEADYPVISITQTSAQVSAANLPRKMLRPYFLIRSNIIGDMNYYGGSDSGQNLPIVCVVNKENGFGDFYFQRGFDLEFTITHPKVLTSITTSIHDPDMRLSNVSGDSAVIFKIIKQNNANLDVVQDVLQEQNNVMMRHAEALRIAQEEEIREQVRNGVDISDIDGVREGVGDDVMMPVAPAGPPPVPAGPRLPAGSVVSPAEFQQAVGGMRATMAQPPGTPIPLPQGQQAVEEIEDSGAPIGGAFRRSTSPGGSRRTGGFAGGGSPGLNTAFAMSPGMPLEGGFAPPTDPFHAGLSPISSRGASEGTTAGSRGSTIPSSKPFTEPADPVTPRTERAKREFPRSRLFQRALAAEDPEEQRRRQREARRAGREAEERERKRKSPERREPEPE